MKKRYDDSSIISCEGLELYRKRPELVVHTRDDYGLFHMTKEIIDNALDEVMIDEDSIINKYLKIWLFKNIKNTTCQIAVWDNGRGIPLHSLENVFYKPGTSGKYDQNSYEYSSGLFGIGAKVTTALSAKFKAISFREDGIGVFYAENGVMISTNIINVSCEKTGTLIIFEPDTTIMKKMDVFLEEGYQRIVELLKTFNLFSENLNAEFIVNNKLLPKDIWNKDALEIHEIILNYQKPIIFKTSPNFDSYEYLTSKFNITSKAFWKIEDLKVSTSVNNKLGFSIKLYLPDKFKTNSELFLSLVNNVPIKHRNSSHILSLYTVIKSYLSDKITDKDMQAFFLTYYKLPLIVAISVQYKGAIFSGSTKDEFHSEEFEDLFEEMLIAYINKTYSKEVWNILFERLLPDIETRYNIFSNKTINLPTKDKLSILKLNYPKKYTECSNPNDENSELFIVEGDSASSIARKREAKIQALYALRGKVLNLLRYSDTSVETSFDSYKMALTRLYKNKIYRDLLILLNVKPSDKDISNMTFKFITITTDADPDGYHIGALLIGTLYMIHPDIIRLGRVRFTTPPLYKIIISGNKKPIFLKNKKFFEEFCAKELFMKNFKIKIRTKNNKSLIDLSTKDIITLITIVLKLGELIKLVSISTMVPSYIIEKLIDAYEYLSYETFNEQKVKKILNVHKVIYDKNNTLIVCTENDDIVIQLDVIKLRIEELIFPFLKEINWNNVEIYITSLKNTTYIDEKVSIIVLYTILFSMIRKLKIKQYKGLGELDENDAYETCTSNATRAYITIREVGDIKRIFDLLGNNVEYRKDMLKNSDITD